MSAAPFQRPAPALLEALQEVSSAAASGALTRFGVPNHYCLGLRPLLPGRRLLGVAVTLRYVPTRPDLAERLRAATLPSLEAIEFLQPGDVLVVDALGRTDGGHLGDVMATRIQMKGAAGLVVDGAVRDFPFLQQMDLPVFARGVVGPPSPLLPVEYNVPIHCAGALVQPGDLILGDDDGVCVIPQAWAAEVARVAREAEELEVFLRQKLLEGRSIIGVYPPGEAIHREYEASRQRSSGG